MIITCGLKLTVISFVAESLDIRGWVRLYWDFSPTVSVHLVYNLEEYLEVNTVHEKNSSGKMNEIVQTDIMHILLEIHYIKDGTSLIPRTGIKLTAKKTR